MDKIYKKVPHTDIRVTMQEYLNMMGLNGKNKIGIDPGFQSKERWDRVDMYDFINSCVINLNISKFVLADISSCLAAARVIVHKESIDYYQYWLARGWKFLNIDSNNRTVCLREFVMGNKNIRLPHALYQMNPELPPVVVDETNDTFDTMHPALKSEFLTNAVSVCVFTGATREDLADTFHKMNSGKGLNAYEKINSVFSDTCRIIRNIANDYAKNFSGKDNFFTQIDINRRMIDHWVSTACYRFFKGFKSPYSGSSANKKEMYRRNSTVDQNIETFDKQFRSFVDKIGDPVRFQARHCYLDLFYMVQDELGEGKRFKGKNYDNMKEDFISLVSKLYSAKSVFVWPNGDTTTFSRLRTNESPEQHTMRRQAYEDYGWDITKYFQEVDTKRTGSSSDRISVADRDNYTLPDGTVIENRDEILNGQKYHLGHGVAHAMGGKTIPDNLVIERASDNMSHGMKPIKIPKK